MLVAWKHHAADALCYTPEMQQWPDPLARPDAAHIEHVLSNFWTALATLADLLVRGELILAEHAVANQRMLLLEMMLAANGIAWPTGTTHLNTYLGESQRVALERTLVAAGAPHEAVIARMVALTTIYQWYAPQLVERYGVRYPQKAEADTWRTLVQSLPEWPERLETD